MRPWLALLVFLCPVAGAEDAPSPGPPVAADGLHAEEVQGAGGRYAAGLVSIAEAIEREVCGREFIPDGVVTADGEYVYTATREQQRPQDQGLNCTGFSKAVGDYLHQRLFETEKGLLIDDLTVRHLDLRRDDAAIPYEYQLDPFYGQDWVRNIARVLNRRSRFAAGVFAVGSRGGSSLPGKDLAGDYYDIVEVPGVSFDPRWGFPAAHIEVILDHLSIVYPDSIFFFSIAKRINPEVEILQFAHTGAIVSVRTPTGRQDFVFESNVRNTLTRFQWVNQHRFIYLVRVDLTPLL